MSWTAKMNGYENLSAEMQVAARLGIRDGMQLLGVEGAKMVQDNIATPYNGHPARVATGNLAGSVVHSVIDEQALTRLIIGVSPTAHANVYVGPVEAGAEPHMPPSSELIPWVMRKFGIDDEKTAKSLAFVIARKIAKKGMAAHEMFSRALAELEPKAAPALEHAVAARLIAAGFGGQQ